MEPLAATWPPVSTALSASIRTEPPARSNVVSRSVSARRRLGAANVAPLAVMRPDTESSAGAPSIARSKRACPCRLRGARNGSDNPNGKAPATSRSTVPSSRTNPASVASVPAGPWATVSICQPSPARFASPSIENGPRILGTKTPISGKAAEKVTAASSPVARPATLTSDWKGPPASMSTLYPRSVSQTRPAALRGP